MIDDPQGFIGTTPDRWHFVVEIDYDHPAAYKRVLSILDVSQQLHFLTC